jgi:hypothetical protein
VATNAFVHELSLKGVLTLFEPLGDATAAVVNYNPVHLLLHTMAWEAFGDQVLGHHVVNVVFHVVASLLLIPLLLRSGIPRAGAVGGAVFFLLHPANVEAVAWISQLKSSSSLVLSLAALLAIPRRPALGSALFVLALFAKPTAAFVLPVAILIEWTHEGRVRWRWYALMGLALVAYATVEFIAHQRSGAAEAVLYETPFVLVRTVATHALRYLVMGATSYGVSAFHEPEPAYSWLDPRWICALVVLGLLGWRLAVAVRGRKRELPYWAWALISFGPVSQVFPFLYPVADRYLYFILPGLIGAALLAAGEALDRLPAALEARPGLLGARSWRSEDLRRMASRVGVGLGIAAAVLFAVRSNERANIWRSPTRIVADSAANYPKGTSALILQAKRASQLRDVDGAVVAMRAAMDRGFNRFEQLWTDPAYAPVRDHPKFRALIREMAADWIETIGRHEHPTQLELAMIANAHFVRGEKDKAVEMFRRALARGGPYDAQMRAEIDALELSPD